VLLNLRSACRTRCVVLLIGHVLVLVHLKADFWSSDRPTQVVRVCPPDQLILHGYLQESCVSWMRLPQVSFNMLIFEAVTSVGGMVNSAPRAFMRS